MNIKSINPQTCSTPSSSHLASLSRSLRVSPHLAVLHGVINNLGNELLGRQWYQPHSELKKRKAILFNSSYKKLKISQLCTTQVQFWDKFWPNHKNLYSHAKKLKSSQSCTTQIQFEIKFVPFIKIYTHMPKN